MPAHHLGHDLLVISPRADSRDADEMEDWKDGRLGNARRLRIGRFVPAQQSQHRLARRRGTGALQVPDLRADRSPPGQ